MRGQLKICAWEKRSEVPRAEPSPHPTRHSCYINVSNSSSDRKKTEKEIRIKKLLSNQGGGASYLLRMESRRSLCRGMDRSTGPVPEGDCARLPILWGIYSRERNLSALLRESGRGVVISI